MKYKKYKLYSNCLQCFISVVLVLGIFFRFVNLDQKAYWGDETATSLRISGYRFAELKQVVLRGEEMSVKNLQEYQYPNSAKGLSDLFKGLAIEEPQLPPFYFMMVRFWVQWFGNSVAVTRSFSAVVSLLAFPCIYWLCQELFESSLTGWVAMALIAISPFHVLYAQEARPYSLWTVTILLSSAALLRAIRLKTKLSWSVYAAALALGIYTSVLSGLVALGHGIYVVAHERFRFSKTVMAYLCASLTGLLLFLPWVVAIIPNFSSADGRTSWTQTIVPLTSLVKTWILNLSRIFFDLNDIFRYRNLFLYIVIITLVVYSVYFLYSQTPKRVWLFILTLIGVTALAFVLPDFILGGRRSSVIRYLIPCYLGIQIAIAYLLATKITLMPVKLWRQKLWQLVTVALISSGVVSCAVISQTETWWYKYREIYDPVVAKIINQSAHPLVISPWFNLITLNHVLAPQVRIQDIRQQIELNSLEKSFSDVFVHNSKETLEVLLKKNPSYRIEKIYSWKRQIEPVHTTQTTLWKLAKEAEINNNK